MVKAQEEYKSRMRLNCGISLIFSQHQTMKQLRGFLGPLHIFGVEQWVRTARFKHAHPHTYAWKQSILAFDLSPTSGNLFCCSLFLTSEELWIAVGFLHNIITDICNISLSCFFSRQESPCLFSLSLYGGCSVPFIPLAAVPGTLLYTLSCWGQGPEPHAVFNM